MSTDALDEPAEWTLQRASASFALASTPCPTCRYMPRVNGWRADLGVTVEPRHLPGCPDAEEALWDPNA